MKKTGIAAMMLSTAIAVSSIAVPVCAAPGQTAESAQMQEQPQTETEPAKSISDEDFAKLLDFCKKKSGTQASWITQRISKLRSAREKRSSAFPLTRARERRLLLRCSS